MRKSVSALTGLGLLASLAATGWAASPPARSTGKAPAQRTSRSTPTRHEQMDKHGGKMVNLNTASEKELRKVPGIGKARAARIMKARPFASVNDLVTKKILTAKELARVRKNVTVE